MKRALALLLCLTLAGCLPPPCRAAPASRTAVCWNLGVLVNTIAQARDAGATLPSLYALAATAGEPREAVLARKVVEYVWMQPHRSPDHLSAMMTVHCVTDP